MEYFYDWHPVGQKIMTTRYIQLSKYEITTHIIFNTFWELSNNISLLQRAVEECCKIHLFLSVFGKLPTFCANTNKMVLRNFQYFS